MSPSEKATHWKSLIEQHQQSGLSIKAFCCQQQINLNTFHYWRKKFSASNRSKEQPIFVPLNHHANELIGEASITLSERVQLRVPIQTLGTVLSQLKREGWL